MPNFAKDSAWTNQKQECARSRLCPPYAPETYIFSPFLLASKRRLQSPLLPDERFDHWRGVRGS
ncbi:hypothetical protein CN245_15290 [Sinorhizobium meliloti]|nr:hypothetical protein CN245_15290 [Sinorhizobium meliloti]